MTESERLEVASSILEDHRAEIESRIGGEVVALFMGSIEDLRVELAIEDDGDEA